MGPAQTAEIKVKDDLNLSGTDIDVEMVDKLEKLEAEVAEEGQDANEVKFNQDINDQMTKRQKKQFIRMLTGKKPLRANQTKPNGDKPKKKKGKRNKVKAARRKNRN